MRFRDIPDEDGAPDECVTAIVGTMKLKPDVVRRQAGQLNKLISTIEYGTRVRLKTHIPEYSHELRQACQAMLAKIDELEAKWNEQRAAVRTEVVVPIAEPLKRAQAR
jgi:hypothetical protein